MKIAHEPEQIYTLVVGEKRFPGMRQVGAWEGLIKLQGDAGIAIVTDQRGHYQRSIDDAFGYVSGGTDNGGWAIVSASDQILAALKAEASA